MVPSRVRSIWDAYATTLDSTERAARIAELQRIQSEELPVIPHFFNMQITAHLATLRGPLARVVPGAASEVFNIHLWTRQPSPSTSPYG